MPTQVRLPGIEKVLLQKTIAEVKVAKIISGKSPLKKCPKHLQVQWGHKE